jgi:hypothetical protein
MYALNTHQSTHQSELEPARNQIEIIIGILIMINQILNMIMLFSQYGVFETSSFVLGLIRAS